VARILGAAHRAKPEVLLRVPESPLPASGLSVSQSGSSASRGCSVRSPPTVTGAKSSQAVSNRTEARKVCSSQDMSPCPDRTPKARSVQLASVGRPLSPSPPTPPSSPLRGHSNRPASALLTENKEHRNAQQMEIEILKWGKPWYLAKYVDLDYNPLDMSRPYKFPVEELTEYWNDQYAKLPSPVHPPVLAGDSKGVMDKTHGKFFVVLRGFKVRHLYYLNFIIGY
jgi:hypothetical protein